MRKLRQCSWKRGDCRSGKKIFAVEAVRSSFAAVGREKQRIISRVAMFYLAVHGYREFPPCRFDVVGIDGEKIHWIKNAFDFCR